MAFLSDLGNIINEQFSFGENSVTSFDTNGDRVGNFGKLGDFAKKFDNSADRTYIEDGLINNIRPRMREVIFQEPDLTVIIKKRMFSSLIENSRLDLLEEKERLFIRASKKLFQNKCKLMSIYERLSKIERVSMEAGQFNIALVPIVLEGISELQNGLGKDLVNPETRSILEDLRRAITFSETSNFTTWVTDFDQVFAGELGEGTGAIELTTVSSIQTKVSTEFGSGSCSFSLEDPYKILRVTSKDIDQAISDSQNSFKNSPVTRFAEIELRDRIDDIKARLNILREGRAVSPIRFVISAQTIISKRVRAIREWKGQEVNFTYNAGLVGLGSSVDLDSKELEGIDGFTDDEARLFKEIISDIFLYIGMQNTSQVKIREFNQEMNYVRNKMRLQFKGKAIINHMDVVNVFMNTKTTEDIKMNEGFPGFQTSGGFSVGQRINNLVRGINNSLADLSGTKTSPDEIEKSLIVGPNFPTWLWRMFRNSFTSSAAGTTVFVGLVKNVTQNYDSSSGRYTMSVECEDNSGYFSKSQVNLKPSLQVFNSTLYDPLTPFDVSFDAATGKPINEVTDGQFPPLLPENQILLETRALKFKSTDFKGQNANQILYKTKKNEVVFGKLRQVLADSDGFVSRWKQGIGVISKVERADPESTIGAQNPVKLTTSPFAGQDVMNVLSLLITGVPYNYNTFLKAAKANGNDIQAYDPVENIDTHSSYIDGVLKELSKRNVLWGNFVPFKELSINDEAFAFLRKGQADLTTRQSKIQSLLKDRARKMDERSLSVASRGELESTDLLQGIDKEISDLDLLIEKETKIFSDTQAKLFTSKFNGSIKIVGDDISLEPGFDSNDGTASMTEEEKSLSRREMRRRINSFTLRRLWKVKGNSDNNLLIVDDQYDKNYDIQAFERKIDGALALFDSEYLTVDGQIKEVAKILGLEIFADSQGHIRIRPPLYNRIPSSVFYKMFKERDDTGVKVFPDFLESLLFNQVKSMTDRIEIIEDEIRIRAIAINVSSTTPVSTDNAIKSFISGGNSPVKSGGPNFVFLTDPTTGTVPGEFIRMIPQQANPDEREAINNQNLEALTLAQGQASVQKAFDITTRVNIIKKQDFEASVAEVDNNSKINIIRSRLLKNKGYKAPTVRDLLSNERVDPYSGKVSDLSILNVLDQIANLVSERQKIVKVLSSTLKNLQEGLLINVDDYGAKSAMTPFLNRKTTIPSILEYMIEDESNDDLGIGSGNRFVIKEHQIISKTYTENPPPYTAVQVNGLFAEGFVDAPSQLGANLSGASGGNAIVSAYAVDYDMWYQYGFRAANSIHAPWASDPEAQCAPYAVTLLNIARKNIFMGSVTISGWNEYYQAGDVIYIEDDDLLFYVTDVSHSFDFKGPLTTTLILKYGHSPGEYIPTPLDIVGKHLYTAQGFSEKYRSSRFDVNGSDISLGAFVIGPSVTPEEFFKGPHGQHNRTVLGKLLYAATGALNPVAFSNQKPILQLRVYGENGDADINVKLGASLIAQLLVNPKRYSTVISAEMPDISIQDNFKLNLSDISYPDTDSSGNFDSESIVDIDNDTRSPSSSAWNLVRLIDRNGAPGIKEVTDDSPSIVFGSSGESFDRILMQNIVDAFITFEPVIPSIYDSNQENQAAKENNQKIQEATIASRNARVE